MLTSAAMRGASRLALALCLAAGQAAAEDAGRRLLDGIAAYVGGSAITVGDVMVRLQPVRRQLAARFEGEELRTELRKAYRHALDALIERRLILDAFAAGGGTVPEAMVDRRAGEVMHEVFAGDRERLLATLAREGLTYDEWRTELREQIILSSMRAEKVQKRLAVSASEVRAAYDRDPGRYRRPAEARLRLIAISRTSPDGAPEREKARQAIERLAAGEDFGAVARSVSDGPKAAEGGDWGWTETALLRPELAARAATLPPGRVSDLIETDRQFYIMLVEDRRGGGIDPFERVQQSIERELRDAAAAQLYDAWIAGLRRGAFVKVTGVDPFEP